MIHRPVRWTSKRDIDVTRVSPRVAQYDVWSTGFAREAKQAIRMTSRREFRYWLESTIFQKITTRLGWLATCCTKEDLHSRRKGERGDRRTFLLTSYHKMTKTIQMIDVVPRVRLIFLRLHWRTRRKSEGEMTDYKVFIWKGKRKFVDNRRGQVSCQSESLC